MKHLSKATGVMHLSLVLAFLLAFCGASQLPAKVIYQMPADIGVTWLECVLVRDNGDLLLTTVSPSPSIYTLSRPWDAEPKITSNITLPNSNLTGALGLADLRGNIYAVAAGTFHDSVTLTHHTSEVWLLDLSDPGKPTTHHVASMPEAGELNDMVVLKGHGNAADILVADSSFGRIWKVSMETGKYSVWLESPEMGAHIDPKAWPFGINGMRYGTDGYLYFSNTNTRIIWRIKMHADGSVSPNDVEFVHKVHGAAALDNFAVDKDNRLWVASNKDNKLILVEQQGHSWKSKVVLGGDTKHVVAGDTAVAFETTKKEADTLYVVTSGAFAAPVPNGSPNGFTEPAKVVQVDVSGV